MFTDRRGIAQNVYLIVIGALLVLFAGSVALLVVNRERPSLVPATGTIVTEPTGSSAAEPTAPSAPTTGLIVSWRDVPLEMTDVEVAAALGLSGSDVSDVVTNSTEEKSSYYKVGTVTSVPYVGMDLLVAFMPCNGPCFEPMMMRFIIDRSAHRLVNLSAYGLSKDALSLADVGEMSAFFENGQRGVPFIAPGKRVVDDAELRIPDLDVPARLALKDSSFSLVRSESEGSRFVTRTDVVEVGRTADGRTVYAVTGTGCLLIARADHTYVQYDLELLFLTDGRIPDIEWSNGDVNGADYVHGDVGGCGAQNCYAVRPESEVRSASRLVTAGLTSTGDTIYALKDSNDAELKKVYDDGTQYVPEGETKPAYAAFLTKHPLFYWKDSFGRWIRFVRQDVLPAVECGKPVIYLYPQKEMSVSVRVGLKGKMTVSEPPHGATGWKVVARPDGYVVNAADGKTYPNLFWEGTGVGYQTPKEGFVVKTAEADAWLTNTLATIGFTERESAEFREFWVPRLPKTPYAFITFVPQADFDRDAPLMISPRPDNVYRVFMEYRGLEAPISVKPLTLPKIERSGFTVVEWGGALKK